MSSSDDPELIVLLHCRNLPGVRCGEHNAVRLGIQKGQEVVEDVPGDSHEVTFRVPLRVGTNVKTAQPSFTGPFAHGTPGDRFLYLSWGERQGKRWDMFRRAKVRLGHIAPEEVRKSLDTGKPVEITLNMTDAKGAPACANLKPQE